MATETDDMTTPVVVSDLPTTVLTEELMSDYLEYLKVDSSQEEKHFSESIDEMLTKLDEFCGLVDMNATAGLIAAQRVIRGDSTLCLYKTLPEISTKAAEMQKVFDKIDQLEEFVSIVSKNVHMMEEHVNKAETKMGSLSGIKKMITSLVSPKHSAARSRANPRADNFQPPEIFDTSEYFPKQMQQSA